MLTRSESLNEETAKRYRVTLFKREHASDQGAALNPSYFAKKQTVFQKIPAFVEKFRGVGEGSENTLPWISNPRFLSFKIPSNSQPHYEPDRKIIG